MTDFVPSTTQEGQGGAQILQSDIQYANASGIVRGIERADAKIQLNKKEQYEEQKQREKDKQERLKGLYDLQSYGSPRARELSEAVIEKSKNRVIEYGADPYETWLQDRGELIQIKEYQERVKEIAKNISDSPDKHGYHDEEGEEWMFGTNSVIEDSKKSRNKDASITEELAELMSGISSFGNNPNNMILTGKSLEETYLQDVKAAQQSKTTREQLLANGDIETAETITPLNAQERMQKLLNNEQIKQQEKNRLKLQYNVTEDGLSEKIGMSFEDYYNDKVKTLFEDEAIRSSKQALPKKTNNDGGGSTNNDLVQVKATGTREIGEGYKKGSTDEIGVSVLKEGSKTTEQSVTIMDDDEKQKQGFIKAITKDAYGKPKIKVEFKEDGETKSRYRDLDDVKEYLIKRQVDEIQSKFDDVKMSPSYDLDLFITDLTEGLTAKPKTAQDLILFIPEATDITDPKNDTDDISFKLGGESYSFNLDGSDEDLATFKKLVKDSNTPKQAPKPREAVYTDDEVKAMYGKKVSKETFKKMTVKQRAKFAQNAGSWE